MDFVNNYLIFLCHREIFCFLSKGNFISHFFNFSLIQSKSFVSKVFAASETKISKGHLESSIKQ